MYRIPIVAMLAVAACAQPSREALERKLQNEPNDARTRLRLLELYRRPDVADRAESRKRIYSLSIWLVQNEPNSEILASPYAMKGRDVAGPDYAPVAALWERALAAHPNDARAHWNAALFFDETNPIRYRRCLERAVELDPSNREYGTRLGMVYAQAMFSRSEPIFAAKAREALDKSKNAAILEGAARDIHNQYIRTVLLDRRPNEALRDSALRFFERARALNPAIDRQFILPEVPSPQPPTAGRSHAKIRRLRPSAFPDLPAAVATVLSSRRCTIPQPDDLPPAKRNVIRGRFLSGDESGWAVLCSIGGASSILVFRSDSDERPLELARSADENWMQGATPDRVYYSREIRPVGREYILRHYRAYGGPKPPPIDHQGIDDAFLEKASVIWYWYGGKWRRLQGAD